MSKYHQGRYRVKNPAKYVGDLNNVIFRSSWELRVLQWLDNNPSIVYFSSEELVIPYFDPVTQRRRRYFPDFLVKVKTKSGEMKTTVIEVKPFAQTQLRAPKRHTRKFLGEVAQYSINKAKWDAAIRFCEEQGWNFQIITEKDLGLYEF